ncbi:MAG: hypothetical protein MJ209_07225 [archaeon]|nr:hypothetical protein [archaeon]
MNLREKIGYIIILLVVFTFVINLGAINSFLSFQTDKTIQIGDSTFVVPDGWNTTKEYNITSRNGVGMYNEYIILDVCDDWPEDHMGPLSKAKLSAMEDGNYKTLRSEVIKLGGKNVTREYFTNPSLDTNTSWQHVGVVYMFTKQDRNYTIEAYHFTSADYNNSTYLKEIDDCVEDMMANMQYNKYNWYISSFDSLINHQPIVWEL